MTTETVENQKPKTIAYNYMFDCSDDGVLYENKTITGACIQVAVKAIKNGKEVKFLEEPAYKNTFWGFNYSVLLDEKDAFIIKKKIRVDNIFRLVYDFDEIEAEIVDYSLDYLFTLSDNDKKKLSKENQNLPCTASLKVTEDEFKQFVLSHKNDFDGAEARISAVKFI